MGGRLLAINEGFGYRPIMVVTAFNFLPQYNERPPTTFVYGDQVMILRDDPSDYLAFLNPLRGQALPWVQLALRESETEEQLFTIFPRLPVVPILEQRLVLLSAGKDPLRGYYVQFAGPIALFSQPDWWVDRDPEY